jgi:phosphatidate cytidylyltransferase
MLAKRVLVVILLLPVGLFVIYMGGLVFAGFIALVLALAAWEYVGLFRTGGFKPAAVIVTGAAVLFVAGRFLNGFESAPWIISLVVLLSMIYHLFAFELSKREKAGTDFGITMGGAFYIGWLGAYLVSLRALDGGEWWILFVLPAVWFADSGAYFVGKKFGRHKITPRLSPKKTWEGYLAGIVIGILGTVLLAVLYQNFPSSPSAITPINGVIMGAILSVFTILGDLGESLFKRQVGIKDSSNLLPGHGGVFDRIDSWLWAGVIGYYLIVWLF